MTELTDKLISLDSPAHSLSSVGKSSSATFMPMASNPDFEWINWQWVALIYGIYNIILGNICKHK